MNTDDKKTYGLMGLFCIGVLGVCLMLGCYKPVTANQKIKARIYTVIDSSGNTYSNLTWSSWGDGRFYTVDDELLWFNGSYTAIGRKRD